MALIHLIRHARPSSAWGGADGDPGLDDTGLEQARDVARLLLAQPAERRPRQVVSSPLRRCRETAAPLAAALGVAVLIDPTVGEIPTPVALSHAARPDWLRAAMSGRWADIVGDRDYEVWRREVAAAVAAWPGGAVFSHFVAINAVLSLLAGRDEVVSFRPDHVSVTTLEVAESGLVLVETGREMVTGVL